MTRPHLILLASSLIAGAIGACAPAEPPPVVPLPPSSPSAPASAPEPAPKPVLAVAAVPPPERDDRFSGRPLRPRALLVTEIQALETLFAASPPSAPDRPAMLRRLADTYVELERRAEADRAEQAANAPEAGKAGIIARAARDQAIKYYARLADQFPTYCVVPSATDPRMSTDCVDSTLYYHALESERAGQLDAARRSYLRLIQAAPDSRFVPLAYLAFGEMFMNEARNDPSKFALAVQAYEEVVRFPPPDNKAFAYARERLGQAREGARHHQGP